tara:strand:- start:5693 stop:6913 length:1221 start_codon:yes stop_codon:yes gene_type:complete
MIPNSSPIPQVNSLLLLPGQRSIPDNIRSVQFFNSSQANSPLVTARLKSNDRLILRFDELSEINGMFRVHFSHRNSDWTKSNLPLTWFMGSINERIVQGGIRNQSNSIPFHTYDIQFLLQNLEFLVSGFYFIHVSDYTTGIELFSLPFALTEQLGTLELDGRTLYNNGNLGTAIDRIFAEFSFPEFVDMPIFDLNFDVVQDGFLRRARRALGKDFSEEKVAKFYLEESQSYPANSRFYNVNLYNFGLSNQEILEYRESDGLPRITLKEDFLSFSDSPFILQSMFGDPSRSTTARYAFVNFRFNPMGAGPNYDDDLFLLGDFNQWSETKQHKMKWNPELRLFEATILLKEGSYRYTYATRNGTQLNIVELGSSLTKENQWYTGILFYRDPNLQYDRILFIEKVQILP